MMKLFKLQLILSFLVISCSSPTNQNYTNSSRSGYSYEETTYEGTVNEYELQVYKEGFFYMESDIVPKDVSRLNKKLKKIKEIILNGKDIKLLEQK